MDCLSLARDYNSCPEGADVLITQYRRDGTRVTWNIVRGGECNIASGGFDSAAHLPASSLRQVRAGYVVSVLTGEDPSTYTGRTAVRGVPADTYYTGGLNLTNLGVTYTFSATTHFFPEGWAFPGRPNATGGMRYPQRVVFDGLRQTADGSVEVRMLRPAGRASSPHVSVRARRSTRTRGTSSASSTPPRPAWTPRSSTRWRSIPTAPPRPPCLPCP